MEIVLRYVAVAESAYYLGVPAVAKEVYLPLLHFNSHHSRPPYQI